MTGPDQPLPPPLRDTGPLETMARELAPCPFCGTDEFLILSNSLLGVHSFWQVECGCHASGAPEMLRENAIKVWNTRPPTVPRKLYDAIGDLVSECADQRDIYPDDATALRVLTNTVNEIYACMEDGVFGPLNTKEGE